MVPKCPNLRVYTIEAGDTLYRIAQRYEISVASLLQVNPGLNPNSLQIGQKICLPIPKCPMGKLTTVRVGDTIYKIAQRYGITVDQILQVNPGLDPDMLFVGQKICLPEELLPVCAGLQTYEIKAGDSIYRIARRYGLSVDAILKANDPELDPDKLFIGQIICLPGELEFCPEGQRYVIKAGDNFNKLAQKFKVSVDEIINANAGINPNTLQIGQEICIPTSSVQCPEGQVYVIQPGDDLYKVASKYNISLEELLKLNPQISDPSKISVGQNICVPSS